jgi:hypothetical protein
MSHEESGGTCACGGNCSCQSSDQTQNVYLTREEYIERLEHYLVDLKAEIESVESELAELKTPVLMATG